MLAAAREIAAACVEWDNGESSPDEWVDDLLKCHWDWDDGYKLAKALDDRCHVSSDMALAEALDGASHALWTAHEAAVRQWAVDNNVQPSLEVGARVTCRFGEGVVGSIDKDRAIYLFVPDAERERYARGGGIHLNFEDASAIEARRAETAQQGSVADESAVPTADAQTSSQDTSHDH